jgi:hypothetical protein
MSAAMRETSLTSCENSSEVKGDVSRGGGGRLPWATEMSLTSRVTSLEAGRDFPLGEGDVSVCKGEISADKRDVSLGGGDVSVCEGDVSVREGDVSVREGDVSASGRDVSICEGDAYAGGRDISARMSAICACVGDALFANCALMPQTPRPPMSKDPKTSPASAATPTTHDGKPAEAKPTC